MIQLSSCNPRGVTTSCYSSCNDVTQPTAISRSTPDTFSGRHLLVLSPPWSIIRSYKSGKINWSEYEVLYRKHILSQPITITEIYWSLPEQATLLCYEQPGQNCHRRIVADMIFEEMGFTIPEYDPRDIEGIHSEIEFM